MIICGIKLTHDGGIALIENGVLSFSIEMEKLKNNPRYSQIDDLSDIASVLNSEGYSMEDVNHFVIDGWHGSGEFWTGPSIIQTKNGRSSLSLQVAPYNEHSLEENVFHRFTYGMKFSSGGKEYEYSSYMHCAGHIASAYCTSPFAKNGESSYVLLWDGGLYPRLYYFDSDLKQLSNLGHLFLFLGTVYSIFPQYFGPFRKTDEQLEIDRAKKDLEGYFGGYSVAGKVMSYIALGDVREELIQIFDEVYKRESIISNQFEHLFSKRVRELIDPALWSDEDVLASFHVYLERLLVDKLREKVHKYNFKGANICFTGGCALNIKWNTAIRESGLFKDMYVPPFPNDSGSAIGAACCEYAFQTRAYAIDWSVYSGPSLDRVVSVEHDWNSGQCSVQELAGLLYSTGEPVAFLTGKAELGPRALGHRSILASPFHPDMKRILNFVKGREFYRPVAPICVEEFAPTLFEPGCADPYMLFDHKVKKEWIDRIPAVCHLDGTARLQTVVPDENDVVYRVLKEFGRLSGLPVLCNTSANLNGSGFFCDLKSAMNWGKVNFIWSDEILYTRKIRIEFSEEKSNSHRPVIYG